MIYDTIIHKTPIDKGWSGDRKFWAITADGTQYLLRISPTSLFDRKKQQFEQMQRVDALGIPMCRPVEFGQCPEGVYVLHTWVQGQDAEETIARMPRDRQYAYGLDAGRILKTIHSLPAPADVPPWGHRFSQKIDRKIRMYTDCPLKYEGGEAFLRHIAAARHLLSDRPQTYQHGDYHVGNMMIDETGNLTVIDFDRDDYGDPWEEFNRIVWCAQAAPNFARGMVDGYFDGQVPMNFWNLLALYICSNTLSSLPWAIDYGEHQIQVMRDQAAEILLWYDHFHSVIPTWYKKEA